MKYLVETESGAEYIVEYFTDEDGEAVPYEYKDLHITTQANNVTGGSKQLETGVLLNSPIMFGKPLLIYTPQRGHLNPQFRNPCVCSTQVVKITALESIIQ